MSSSELKVKDEDTEGEFRKSSVAPTAMSIDGPTEKGEEFISSSPNGGPVDRPMVDVVGEALRRNSTVTQGADMLSLEDNSLSHSGLYVRQGDSEDGGETPNKGQNLKWTTVKRRVKAISVAKKVATGNVTFT